MLNIGLKFKASLTNYLKDPLSQVTKDALVACAVEIYHEAIKEAGSPEPGKYLHYVDGTVKLAAEGIKISLYLAQEFESYLKELSESAQQDELWAFNVLTLAYHTYLDSKRFIMKRWDPMREAIEHLQADYPFYKELKELDDVRVELRAIVYAHFRLPYDKQLKQHAEWEKKLKDVCFKHKSAIESNAEIKAVYDALLIEVSRLYLDEKAIIKEQLDSMQDVINCLGDNHPYHKELRHAGAELKSIVDEYFKLAPDKQLQQHAEWEKKLKDVCFKHKSAIESNAQIKAIFYSFLEKISLVLKWIGVSVSDKYKNKCMFFKEASLEASKPLLDFTSPSTSRD